MFIQFILKSFVQKTISIMNPFSQTRDHHKYKKTTNKTIGCFIIYLKKTQKIIEIKTLKIFLNQKK
ncbi:hypothetical protein SAMN02927916_0076 [Flavobacterium anhuiense]|uniref:Uncharacterized protein n=1 Tax=Flavobacterium anhuiense TaxID=459526 RepID=A0ABY0M5J7_9FLAO|nr:hypothetical protein SAMN02927916_0076 [Flavobacterium anhuiense]